MAKSKSVSMKSLKQEKWYVWNHEKYVSLSLFVYISMDFEDVWDCLYFQFLLMFKIGSLGIAFRNPVKHYGKYNWGLKANFKCHNFSTPSKSLESYCRDCVRVLSLCLSHLGVSNWSTRPRPEPIRPYRVRLIRVQHTLSGLSGQPDSLIGSG